MPQVFTDNTGNRVIIRHKGPIGKGIPTGGTVGQILVKDSSDDYDTHWAVPPNGTDAVAGPDSAFNLNVAVFDGTTGKKIRDGGQPLSNYASVSLVSTKVDKVVGKELSTNDFTTAEKTLLARPWNGAGYRGSFATIGIIEATTFDPVPSAGDYCLIEVSGEDIQEVLWDAVNSVWFVQSTAAVSMTGQEIADVIFDADDAAVWDIDECRIFTQTEKAQLAAHQSLIDSLLGGIGATTASYVEKTSNYVVTTSDRTINCTANSFVLTLPTALADTGRIFTIKNSGTGIITVNTVDGIQMIDGTNSYELTVQWESITVQSTGSNWILI